MGRQEEEHSKREPVPVSWRDKHSRSRHRTAVPLKYRDHPRRSFSTRAAGWVLAFIVLFWFFRFVLHAG